MRKKQRAKPEDDRHDDGPDDDSAGDASERTQNAGTTTEDAERRKLTPDEQIGELEAKCQDLNGRWMRAQADYQNLRRRAHTDLETGIKRNMAPLLEELLFVLDFLDMALASPATHDETKNLVMGIQMTRTKFVQALENSNVTEIPTTGEFDPALHDATEVRDVAEAEPGSIVATVRKGYTWKEHVLRHAQVAVAKSADDDTAAPGAPTDATGPTATNADDREGND